MEHNRFSKYGITLSNGQVVNVYDAFEALSGELKKEFIADVFNDTFCKYLNFNPSAEPIVEIIDTMDTDLFNDFTRRFAQLMAERTISYAEEVINNKY